MTIGVDGAVSAFRVRARQTYRRAGGDALRSFRPFLCGQQLLEVHFDFSGSVWRVRCNRPPLVSNEYRPRFAGLSNAFPSRTFAVYADSRESGERLHGIRNLTAKCFDHGFLHSG